MEVLVWICRLIVFSSVVLVLWPCFVRIVVAPGSVTSEMLSESITVFLVGGWRFSLGSYCFIFSRKLRTASWLRVVRLLSGL